MTNEKILFFRVEMFGNNEKFLKIFGSNDNLKGNIMNDVINNKNNDRDFF